MEIDRSYKCDDYDKCLNKAAISNATFDCIKCTINGGKIEPIHLPEAKLFRMNKHEHIPNAKKKRGRPPNFKIIGKETEKHIKEGEKCCYECEKIKPLSDFHKKPLGLKGVNHRCKQCRSDYRKQPGNTPVLKLNFTKYPEIHVKLEESARNNMRTMELEAMYLLQIMLMKSKI